MSYDEIKGTQDQNLFSCSFSDSLIATCRQTRSAPAALDWWVCRFTGSSKRVVVIRNMTDFNKVSISDLIDADIVVSCPTLFHRCVAE